MGQLLTAHSLSPLSLYTTDFISVLPGSEVLPTQHAEGTLGIYDEFQGKKIRLEQAEQCVFITTEPTVIRDRESRENFPSGLVAKKTSSTVHSLKGSQSYGPA